MLRVSTGSGDSNTELGRGSMVGVVEISRAAGVGTEEESPSVAVDSLSFSWGTAERGNDFTEPPSAAGGSLAKSGSVTSGASWEEAEDRGRGLLACMTPSSLGAVAGMLDKDEAERPLGSLGSSSLGCTCTNAGVVISAVDRMVRSTAEEAVDSMVEMAVVAAS